VKVVTGTVEKLVIQKMVIAFEIFSLGDTEPELHLEGHLPLNCNVRFKKYYCNTRVIAGTQPNNFRGMQG